MRPENLSSVLIITYNSADVVGLALRSIPERVPIIVVDNNSTDSTVEYISSSFPHVTLIQSGENVGFAKAVNLGMRSVSTEFVLFLNPDAKLSEGALETLLETMKADPSLGIVSPLVVEGQGQFRTSAAGFEPDIFRMFTHATGLSRLAGVAPALRGHYLLRDQLDDATERDVLWVSGGCLLTRVAAYQQVGGLTERWFMYAEDVDYCLRVGDVGWAVRVSTRAHATHQVGASSSHEPRVRTEWLRNLFDLYTTRYKAGRLRSRLWLGIVAGGFYLRAALMRIRRNPVDERRFTVYASAAKSMLHDLGRSSRTAPTSAESASRAARYYPVARTAHLERLVSQSPATFFYTRTRQDWDLRAAPQGAEICKTSLLSFLRRVWCERYTVIEVPEPLAIPLLPHLLAIAAAVKLQRIFTRNRQTTLVFYAIENFDQVRKLSTKVSLPPWVLRTSINIAMAFVLSEASRAAFGTQGSLELYSSQMGPSLWRFATRRVQVREFPALSAASSRSTKRDPNQVCFLGSLEERKGILTLMDAWPAVVRALPSARLTIMGHGPLNDHVISFCRDRPEVKFVETPDRLFIQAELASSHVLVLLSQPTPVWREQVGLPILEGLAEGCEVVATTETGIAAWLASNQHHVLDPQASREQVVAAIVSAIGRERSAQDVKNSLPAVDGRLRADQWMFSVADRTGETS